jgi:hypothetical protein
MKRKIKSRLPFKRHPNITRGDLPARFRRFVNAGKSIGYNRITVSVAEAVMLSCVSSRILYEDMKAGRLRFGKLGRDRRISLEDLILYQNEFVVT